MKFDAEEFKEALSKRLKLQYGKKISQASKHDLFDAVSAASLDIIMEKWMQTRKLYEQKPTRQVYYFSAEFLMGRAMSNNLINAQIKEAVEDVLKEIDVDYTSIEDEEPDAGLGDRIRRSRQPDSC